MTNTANQAAGFFRFPARLAVRVVRVVRAERVDCHATRVVFRVRHTEAEPIKLVPVDGCGTSAPVRGPAARITVRV